MDTIIGLYRARYDSVRSVECAYEITIFPVQDYRLIRVELREDFFDGLFAEKDGLMRQTSAPRKCRTMIQRRILHREKRLVEFKRELAALLDERDNNYCFASKSLQGCPQWQKVIPIPEFEGYLEWNWVQRLLPYAIYPHFIVLGAAPYLTELLCMLAPRMKSLLWILPACFDTVQLENFAEDFYQEYGLAMDMRLFGKDESYGHMRVESKWLKNPVSILDFRQDWHIPEANPESGGIWLDLAALEEKKQRIESRRLGITYFSLKEQWETIKKRR